MSGVFKHTPMHLAEDPRNTMRGQECQPKVACEVCMETDRCSLNMACMHLLGKESPTVSSKGSGTSKSQVCSCA